MSSGEPLADGMTANRHDVAVLVPCHNEERTIAKVVADFRTTLPAASIYVYDNNSTDHTAEAARQAGAAVRRETRQGKGYVVRRMFSDIEADIYVLVDGDATYDALSASAMIAKLIEERPIWLSRAVSIARRRPIAAVIASATALLAGLVTRMFGSAFTDILSGYRVFSRRFVKSFPVLSAALRLRQN